MKRLLCAAAFLAMATACVTPASSGEVDLHGVDAPEMPLTTATQVAPYLKAGTAVIRGRVVAKLPGVPLLYYRRVTVDLIPAVPFVFWAIDNGMRVTQGEPTLGDTPPFTAPLRDAIRTTTSGPSGEYSFLNVPALPYVVFVAASEDESRSGTSYHTEFTTVPVYEPDGSENFESNSEEVPSTYYYTCHSRGWLYGYVTGVADATTPASLALMYFRNDGC